MTGNRWWHVFFGATMLVVAALALVAWSPWPTRWPALVTIAVLVACYALFGHRGFEDPRAAWGFLPVVLVATFVLTAVSPTMAVVQSIAYPLVWCQVRRLRVSVLLSALVAVATSLGFLVAMGSTTDTWAQIVFAEGISLVGSCALGVWISGIADRSEERRRLLDELSATQDSLAVANRTAGVVSERERIARELHDTIAQNLAGMVMLAQRARRELDSGRVAAAEERLALLEDSAREALEESRTLVAAGTAGLAAGGLGGALQRLAERHRRESDIAVTVAACPDEAVDRDAQVVLLRVAQEALANVRAHARASSVRVTLRSSAPPLGHHLAAPGQDAECAPEAGGARASVELRVDDDGVGFDPDLPAPGFGLRGLRERIALAGGTFAIESAPGRGTTVVAALPVGAAEPVAATASRSIETSGSADDLPTLERVRRSEARR